MALGLEEAHYLVRVGELGELLVPDPHLQSPVAQLREHIAVPEAGVALGIARLRKEVCALTLGAGLVLLAHLVIVDGPAQQGKAAQAHKQQISRSAVNFPLPEADHYGQQAQHRRLHQVAQGEDHAGQAVEQAQRRQGAEIKQGRKLLAPAVGPPVFQNGKGGVQAQRKEGSPQGAVEQGQAEHLLPGAVAEGLEKSPQDLFQPLKGEGGEIDARHVQQRVFPAEVQNVHGAAADRRQAHRGAAGEKAPVPGGIPVQPQHEQGRQQHRPVQGQQQPHAVEAHGKGQQQPQGQQQPGPASAALPFPAGIAPHRRRHRKAHHRMGQVIGEFIQHVEIYPGQGQQHQHCPQGKGAPAVRLPAEPVKGQHQGYEHYQRAGKAQRPPAVKYRKQGREYQLAVEHPQLGAVEPVLREQAALLGQELCQHQLAGGVGVQGIHRVPGQEKTQYEKHSGKNTVFNIFLPFYQCLHLPPIPSQTISP